MLLFKGTPYRGLLSGNGEGGVDEAWGFGVFG